MEHLENHPHAFLDDNNIVMNINVFDGHDHSLIEQVKNAHKASAVVCCCDNGIATIGGDFFNGKFYPVKPGSDWTRDEQTVSWVSPEGKIVSNIIIQSNEIVGESDTLGQ